MKKHNKENLDIKISQAAYAFLKQQLGRCFGDQNYFDITRQVAEALGFYVVDPFRLPQSAKEKILKFFTGPKRNIRRSEESRPVTRPLGEAAKNTLLAELYELQANYESIKSNLDYHKEMAKSAQKRVDGLNDDIHEKITELEHGTETVAIVCEKVMDYDNETITWFNLATGEQVEQRPLKKEERQMILPFNDKRAA